MIEVYDDLVPPYIQNYLYSLINSEQSSLLFPLYVNKNLSEGQQKDFGFENNFTHNPHYYGSILHVLYFLSSYKKIIVQDIMLKRVFYQLPSLNPFIPKKHIDFDEPHSVCLYYVNNSDGDTIFYDKDKEIQRVSPKKGRIALFDGSIEHSAGMPTQNERIVINICFKGLYYGNRK